MRSPAAKEFVMQRTPDFIRGLSSGTSDALSASNTLRLHHQLRFASLFDPGRALSFPCNDCGEVHLDGLSERARNNYFLARTTVGRDYGPPIVIVLETGSIH